MTLLPLHIVAGGMGLVTGYLALSAAKGGKAFLGIVGVGTPQVGVATK